MLVVLQNLTSLLAQGSQNPVLQCDYVIVLILTGIDKLMLSNSAAKTNNHACSG